MVTTENSIDLFQKTVWDFYAQHQRAMPWRKCVDPYWIVVSEIMLQQTQVERVEPKFLHFIQQFPSVEVLAQAPLSQVLALWVGLGYNRRAKFLHGLAKEIVEHYQGTIPQTISELTSLPGIGPNTAGAVLAYAFNKPVVFVETNVRTVYIHHFFADQENVSDQSIQEIAQRALDIVRPREWHWALMDYGSYLKKTYGNNVKKASIYRKQSRFQGSQRQIRGMIIAHLVQSPRTINQLGKIINDVRLPQVLTELHAEKLIIIHGNRVQLAE